MHCIGFITTIITTIGGAKRDISHTHQRQRQRQKDGENVESAKRDEKRQQKRQQQKHQKEITKKLERTKREKKAPPFRRPRQPKLGLRSAQSLRWLACLASWHWLPSKRSVVTVVQCPRLPSFLKHRWCNSRRLEIDINNKHCDRDAGRWNACFCSQIPPPLWGKKQTKVDGATTLFNLNSCIMLTFHFHFVFGTRGFTPPPHPLPLPPIINQNQQTKKTASDAPHRTHPL